MNIKATIYLLTAVLFCAGCAQGGTPVYLDTTADIEDRVEDALSRLTLEEKVAMLSAQSKFSSPGVPRLGIPDVWMSDGPFGIREDNLWDEWKGAKHTNDSCTANPNLTCLAATWNREMAHRYGINMGEEARFRGKTVLLAPGVNIFRTPLCGRNFEYMGEDPFLAAQMAVPYIKGVQENGVAACVKHFALNNQEAHRHKTNSVVDDRALREIYLPAFEAAVKDAGVWAVMGAYNRYKGEFCCENQYLLNGILKKEWGFDGVVVSDWGGTTNTARAVLNGLDMEFGTGTDGLAENWGDSYEAYYLAGPYLAGLRSGKYPLEGLDDKARRVLRLIFRTTMSGNTDFGSFASPEHFRTSREIAQEGVTLLKNDGHLLPLDLGSVKKILVVGDNATARHIGGGGSMYLKTKYEVTPLEGVRALVGDRAEVSYVRGYRPKGNSGRPEDMDELRAEAVEAARDVDVVLFFGGHNRWGTQDCEGVDRIEYGLPYGQEELISALGEVTDRLVVTLVSGSAAAMPWLDAPEAVLYGWYGGSDTGNVIADVLFGNVCPSGKLPFTIAQRLEDYPPHYLNVYDRNNTGDVVYEESIFVGYRWFDKMGIRPLFPFGYGLSYTDFETGPVRASGKSLREGGSLKFRVPVRNVGKVRGAQTVQLYVRDVESSLPRPLKELKDFGKIWLEPGESGTVELTLTDEDLRFYDDTKKEWVAEKGEFEAMFGTSSEDIFQTVKFTLK